MTRTFSSTVLTTAFHKSNGLHSTFSDAAFKRTAYEFLTRRSSSSWRAPRGPIRGHVILKQADALREAEEFLKQFTVVYSNETIFRNAIRGCAAYQLSWFDAQIWSYAEYYGLSEILTEDFQHDRLYGAVRVVNPFVHLRRSL